jgi:predicted ATP-dependent serine protease
MTCGICGAEALFTCRSCGRDVCRQHFSHYTGRCPVCEGTMKEPQKAAPKKAPTRQKAKK